jgi:multicomponent Na+:H+ antiporter subunit E
MPLRTGFVVYGSRLPPGPARAAFCTMMSLLPGTLPCGTDDSGNLIVHCLDTGQPIAEQAAADEALLAAAIGSTHRNG